tara:strand:- start:171 stop:527 length:357 start_codon:yes stop_codon:yes gene_type:complete
MIEEIDNILDYMQRAGLNTISTDSPAWKLLHNIRENKIDISMSSQTEKKLDISIQFENGQKLSVGDLVSHVTVPTLGYGLVVAESENHPDYWIVKWCDPRYHDVGQLGIQAMYLAKVN